MTLLVDLITGVIGGLILAAAGAWAGGQLGRAFGPAGWGDLVGAVVGAAAGYTVGAPLTLALARRWMGRPAAFWPALGASLLGCLSVAVLAEPLGLNRSTLALQGVFAAVAALAAALAQRRWAVDGRARPVKSDTADRESPR